MTRIYKYFVEGECEEKLINSLKVPPYNYLLSGKVEVFNFINKRLTDLRLTNMPRNSIIILVYDVDVPNDTILKENIKKLKKHGFKDIKHIQSLSNFEDEILYSTSLSKIDDMFHTSSKEEFKNKFIHQNNIIKKLNTYNFDHRLLWSRINYKQPFSSYSKKDDLNFIKTNFFKK